MPCPPLRLHLMDSINTDSRDRADMEKLASGHDPALNYLMERHGPAVFNFLLRMLGNEDDAKDLAQETFVRVYQHRLDFKPGARFTSWIYTIAGNLARNHYRWRTRHPNVSLEAENSSTNQSLSDTLRCPNASPAEESLAAERARAVRCAVQSLPEDLKEAIVLCEWEELAVAEAASILQTTPKAVESRLYRARRILREELKSWVG